jgi:hypothetical protein
MYGIVNKAIEELVTEQFGAATWERVKQQSGVDVDFFISDEPYDDAITYQLATALAAETSLPLPDVLSSFGEWWVLRTSKEKYGGLMQAGGHDLREFLINLPLFHNRVMLIYPKLTPPEFKVTDITDRSVQVHYFSHRLGLQDFVRGLLTGLGKMYQTPVTVNLLQSRNEGASHEIFNVTW